MEMMDEQQRQQQQQQQPLHDGIVDGIAVFADRQHVEDKRHRLIINPFHHHVQDHVEDYCSPPPIDRHSLQHRLSR
jgi:hypothetical protein